MTPLEFLTAVWPSTGMYCIATKSGKNVKGMKHDVFDMIEDAAAFVETIEATKDVWFCVHALKERQVKNPHHHKNKKTGEFETGWSVRIHFNMRAARAVFFDLDVGLDNLKKYSSISDAAAALKKFVEDTGLPRPMVVGSGGGLHVYWLLDRELISSTEWLTQASRLKFLAQRCGLKIDPSRTTDTTSLLRVAGTLNLKEDLKRPVDVKIVSPVINTDEFIAQLASLAPDIAAKVEKIEGLGSNMQPAQGLPDPSIKALLDVCPAMRRLEFLHGEYLYPEWFWGLIGNVKFVENGRDLIHQMSQPSSKYTHAYTEVKIDEWKTGPVSCEKVEEMCGSRNCIDCPFREQHNHPIVLARVTAEAPPIIIKEIIDNVVIERIIPKMPAPYIRGEKGGVYIRMEDEKGRTYLKPIYPYDFFPLDRSTNMAAETEQQLWRVCLPFDVVRDFTVDATTFATDQALRPRLHNVGIYPSNFADARHYMLAYMQDLLKNKPVSVQHTHLGWTDDHTEFVLPPKIWRPDGTSAPASLSSVARNATDYICKKGTLRDQVAAMHFFDNPAYVSNQCYILSSLGAVLMFLTGHHGLIVHASGETGTAKSTTLLTAASFWGPPDEYTLDALKGGSTFLARTTRMDTLANLPICLDEITNITSDVAKDMALGISQKGGGTMRLTRGGDPKAMIGGTRATIMLTTANLSLHSLLSMNNIASTAASMRVFEIAFKRTGVHTIPQADAFLQAIRDNYGWIGEIFVQAVVKYLPIIKQRIVRVKAELGMEAAATEEERFWFAKLACDLVAGDIVRNLELIFWNLQHIRKWAIEYQVPYMRSIVRGEAKLNDPVAVLTDYLESINGNIIKLNSAGGGNLGGQGVLGPKGELLAHWNEHLGNMYVLKQGFRNYCERRSCYSQHLLGELVKQGVVKDPDVRHVLGAGTEYGKARSWCFLVDMNHPELADVKPKLVSSLATPKGLKIT